MTRFLATIAALACVTLSAAAHADELPIQINVRITVEKQEAMPGPTPLTEPRTQSVLAPGEQKTLSPQQCQDCGITRFQVWWRVRRMIQRGELERGASIRDASEALAMQLSQDRRFSGHWKSLLRAGWDWDAFITALERILELLAKFIPIFIEFF